MRRILFLGIISVAAIACVGFNSVETGKKVNMTSKQFPKNVQEEYLTLEMQEDGPTIYRTDEFEVSMLEDRGEEKVYSTNEAGESYGRAFKDREPPELVLAENEEGIIGYVRESEIKGASVDTPDEAADYRPEDHYINMYLEDGVTIIGKFFIEKGTR